MPLVFKKIRQQLNQCTTLSQAEATRFYKTAKGEYAANDCFLGVRTPDVRKVAKEFKSLPLKDIGLLIQSKYNEERLLALFILIHRYNDSDEFQKEKFYRFYLKHTRYINNWNLVDASAHYIVGAYLWDKPRDLLMKLARSKILWERRIAIVATWYFIRKNDLAWTFKIAKLLLVDREGLIHKAVGWMLREAGKSDQEKLLKFLDKHAENMSRTMLRYSIERLGIDRKRYIRA